MEKQDEQKRNNLNKAAVVEAALFFGGCTLAAVGVGWLWSIPAGLITAGCIILLDVWKK